MFSTSVSTGGGSNEKYDPFGRLISETSGTQTTANLWDGETLVQQSAGATGAPATTVTNLVTAPASGDPTQPSATTLEAITTGGGGGTGTTYPLYNLHGDPIGATTPQGALSGPLTEYSAFGLASTATTGATATFDGYDPSATGELTSTARAYDPATARFLSPDLKPALNAYSYTANEPVGHFDPTSAEEFIEYSASFYPSLKTVGKCLAKAGQQSPAASFICLAGGDPKATFNLTNGTIKITMGNPGFLGTGLILKQANQFVQAALPAAELKADAEIGPLEASVVGFVQFFFGYDDPKS